MTKKKKILILVFVLISTVALIVAAAFITVRTLDLEFYRGELIRRVSAELNREVRYGKGEFSFGLSPAFTFTDVVILEKDAQTVFITADRLSFKLTLLSLFGKKIVVREAVLQRPFMALIREASGTFNVSDLFNDKKRDRPFGIRRLRIDNGSLHFTDHEIASEALRISLDGLDLRLSRFKRGEAADVELNARMVDAEKSASIALKGSIDIAHASESLLNSRMDMTVKVRDFKPEHFWPYYRRHVPFTKLAGRLDIDTRFRGTAGNFESGGSATLHDLQLDYPAVFRAPLQPKSIHAVYEMKLDPHDINVTNLDVTLDGARIRGSCLLKDIDSNDPLIDARASSTEIRWESFNRYVPFGIIPKSVADFIEQKINAGVFRLDEGRLHGRISGIAHMEKGDNSDALYVRGTANKGVLEYAPGVPVFTDIAGTLELKGKDFILHGMTGKFGEAPFSLDGKLAGYCLKMPVRYPFSLKMAPTAKEAAWLLGTGPVAGLRFDGRSTLRLSGDGIVANYQLSGEWDLTETVYQYPEWLDKPSGKANHLSFKANIKKEEAVFSSIRYQLSPLTLDASATYRPTGKNAWSLTIDSNPVRIEDLAPLLPKIEKFEPRGQLQLSARARGGSKNLSGLRWRGEMALADVSFKPADSIKPVSRVTGKISLRGDALNTSQMAMQLGGSSISARVAVDSLKDPSYAVTLGSERIDLADLGLHHPEQPVQLENVSGSVVFKNRDLQIDALTFRINETSMNIRGAVKNVQDHPEARLDVTSPYLDGQDLRILSDLRRTDRAEEPPARMPLDASFQVDAGRMGRLSFEKLRTNLSLDKNVLYLKGIALNALGGTMTGQGRIDLADAGTPRYHFNFDLGKLSAQQCLQFMDVKDGIITGSFSAKGDLTAKGGAGADLKKTLLGNVRIQVENGMLARFDVLSKIFSILNVSQLLKFQLPDMVHGGMPYSKIVATFSFEDGIISTRDLVISSDAMNLSAVGTIDMPRGQFVEMVVGVQPLQTVDKVVSLIPVVGWILTDEHRSIMNVYFEVKGAMDDPVVTAIPVKGIARGVFDIFKNIFQLPAKLITDTGEVIFGR